VQYLLERTEQYNKLSQVTTIVCRPFQTTHTLHIIYLRTSRYSKTTDTSVTRIRSSTLFYKYLFGKPVDVAGTSSGTGTKIDHLGVKHR